MRFRTRFDGWMVVSLVIAALLTSVTLPALWPRLSNGRRHLIALAEEERFIDEVARLCPQLERKGFGPGMPMAPATAM